MSPEKQRIAMAGLEGWANIRILMAVGETSSDIYGERGERKNRIPHYDTLDDCQRVFRGLTDNQKSDTMELLNIAHFQIEYIIELTPAQWVEAILRATSKWSET